MGDVQKQLENMADRATHLRSLGKNDEQIGQLASEIESHVTPTLSTSQRKSLEDDYEHQLEQMRKQDMSAADAQQAVASFEAAAEKDLDTLQDADSKDVQSLRREFFFAKRDAHQQAKQMAQAGHQILKKMGSPADIELAMERAHNHDASHAENVYQNLKDKDADVINSEYNHVDHLLQKIYSKVKDRLEVKIDAMEKDASSRRAQRRQALAEAARTLKLSGSLSRVEKKLHVLEKAMQKSNSTKGASQEELISSSALVLTNTLCTGLSVAGLAASLVIYAMQRRAESRNIKQPVLLA